MTRFINFNDRVHHQIHEKEWHGRNLTLCTMLAHDYRTATEPKGRLCLKCKAAMDKEADRD